MTLPTRLQQCIRSRATCTQVWHASFLTLRIRNNELHYEAPHQVTDLSYLESLQPRNRVDQSQSKLQYLLPQQVRSIACTGLFKTKQPRGKCGSAPGRDRFLVKRAHTPLWRNSLRVFNCLTGCRKNDAIEFRNKKNEDT